MMHDHQQVANVQYRLEILWRKLEAEGAYVGANTVHMAQRLIKDLTGVNWPDVEVQSEGDG